MLFFKKKLWQAYRLPWEEHHNEEWPTGTSVWRFGKILLVVFDKHPRLSTLLCRSLNYWIQQVALTLLSCIKISGCLHCTRLDRDAYHSPHTVTLNRETSKLLISEPVNASSFLLERLQSGLNNKWLRSAFLIEMRININAIICWWIDSVFCWNRSTLNSTV